jgi:DNA replication protein DnaC
MSEPIKKTLKIALENIPGATMPNSSKIKKLIGKEDCPICEGLGYIRNDVEVNDPNFGKILVCSCRNEEVARIQQQKQFGFSQLSELKHLTFDSFEIRGRFSLGERHANSIETAFNHSKVFSQSLNGWLLLQGKYGSGKTHLAAAVANFVATVGIESLFITVPDLLDSLRFSYDDPNATFQQRFEKIKNVKLLIMDDFGTQNATPWAQEKLFQIINFRYINRLPLVITTNLSITDIEGRIRSRLQDPELVSLVTINAPDFRISQEEGGHHELSSLSLHGNNSFSNFELRKNTTLTKEEEKIIEKVVNASKEYAKKLNGWFVIFGPSGSGKTHLAAAIANQQVALGNPPLFVTIPELMDHLRATFNPKSTVSYDRRFEEIKKSPLLILDDYGAQSSSQWVKEKLQQLINYRYLTKLPTVITSGIYLEEYDDRIRNRLKDRRLVKLHSLDVPPYFGK